MSFELSSLGKEFKKKFRGGEKNQKYGIIYTPGQKPKGVPRRQRILSLSCNSTLLAQNSFGLFPQGYFERKPINLEKTTSSALFVIVN